MRPVPPTRSDHSTLVVICLPLAAHICSCCSEANLCHHFLPLLSYFIPDFLVNCWTCCLITRDWDIRIYNDKPQIIPLVRHVLFSEFYIFFLLLLWRAAAGVEQNPVRQRPKLGVIDLLKSCDQIFGILKEHLLDI